MRLSHFGSNTEDPPRRQKTALRQGREEMKILSASFEVEVKDFEPVK